MNTNDSAGNEILQILSEEIYVAKDTHIPSGYRIDGIDVAAERIEKLYGTPAPAAEEGRDKIIDDEAHRLYPDWEYGYVDASNMRTAFENGVSFAASLEPKKEQPVKEEDKGLSQVMVDYYEDKCEAQYRRIEELLNELSLLRSSCEQIAGDAFTAGEKYGAWNHHWNRLQIPKPPNKGTYLSQFKSPENKES